MISMLEASHFEAASAYASVDRHEENDFKPHIYRTRDGGKSWQETADGIPDGDFVRVVREDPARRGLLYAGTENAAYVSFDDGDHWSPLQLNMPTASVRDLQVRGSDLVAATYGRAFWILDDLSPLRQISAQNGSKALRQTFLYRPDKALRVQLDLNGDTPLPPEMPAGQNPPNGALIDYYLKSAPSEDITLSIYDRSGELVKNVTDLVTLTDGYYQSALALRETLAGDEKKLQNQDAASVAALKDFDLKVSRITGSEGRGGGGAAAGRPKPAFTLLNQELGSLATTVDSADSGPTPAMEDAYADYCHDLLTVTTSWNDLVKDELPPLNEQLAKQRLSALPVTAITSPVKCN
jgi:hypothetical protein